MPNQSENITDKPSLKKDEVPSPFLENIVSKIKDKKVLSKIGRVVVEDYKTDIGSRSKWDRDIKQRHQLFMGTLEKKNQPWEGSSNVNIPILSTACLQFNARSYEALLPSKEIAKCYSTDGKTKDEATRASKFMNWQLTEQMEEWEEDMDNMLLILPTYGSGVKKIYYDSTLGRNVSRTLRADEFVAPYGVKRLEDAPRKTHCYEKYLNQIKINGKTGIWENTEKIENLEAPVAEDKPGTEYKYEADKASGVEDNLEPKDRPRLILEQHRTWDLDGDGIEEPYIITVDKDTETVFRIESPLYTDPITKKRKVFDYFTSYSFIPNADSWMGLGFGHFLEHINLSVNTLTNQLIDSGTLANNTSGFFDRRSGLKSGDITFVLGEFKGVDVRTEDIRKSIYQFEFNPPSQVLFALLQLLQGHARELSSVSEVMLGKLPPSDTTATSMLAVMEQGLKVFSTIHKRIHRYFKKELKKIALLNSIYLDEEIYFEVQDSNSEEAETLTSGRLDFVNHINVKPVSDPAITSRAEKLIRARQAYDVGIQEPLIANDPESRYNLTYDLLDALEVKNIDEILKRPQPPPPPPDLRPEQEEAEFLAERDVKPLPHQDHAQHIQSHRIFEQSEKWSAELTPQGKKLLDAHIRETVALFYLQEKQRVAEEEALQNEFNAGGLSGVEESALFEGVPTDVNIPEGGISPGINEIQ